MLVLSIASNCCLVLISLRKPRNVRQFVEHRTNIVTLLAYTRVAPISVLFIQRLIWDLELGMYLRIFLIGFLNWWFLSTKCASVLLIKTVCKLAEYSLLLDMETKPGPGICQNAPYQVMEIQETCLQNLEITLLY
jgi:hypothetical protein